MSPVPPSHGQARRRPRIRRPGLLRFASVMHILTRLLFVLSVISAPLYFVLPGLSPVQWLITPGAAVLSGIVWAMAASGARCSVCTMKLLIHQPCLKHAKAPSWPGLGHHGTLAVQALYAHKVRCPYCGTQNLLAGAPDDA